LRFSRQPHPAFRRVLVPNIPICSSEYVFPPLRGLVLGPRLRSIVIWMRTAAYTRVPVLLDHGSCRVDLRSRGPFPPCPPISFGLGANFFGVFPRRQCIFRGRMMIPAIFSVTPPFFAAPPPFPSPIPRSRLWPSVTWGTYRPCGYSGFSSPLLLQDVSQTPFLRSFLYWGSLFFNSWHLHCHWTVSRVVGFRSPRRSIGSDWTSFYFYETSGLTHPQPFCWDHSFEICPNGGGSVFFPGYLDADSFFPRPFLW